MIELLKKIIRKKIYFLGPYKNWSFAKKKSEGYHSLEIINKVKNSAKKIKNGVVGVEQDSIIFYNYSYDKKLINIFNNLTQKKINILDYGGSLGSLYYKYKNQIKKNFNWSIIEQKNFVKEGKKNFTDKHLKFFFSVQEYKKFYKPDLILLSSSLQYVRNYTYELEKLIKLRPKYMIFLRTPFSNSDNDYIYVQKPSAKIYNSTYPSWVFSLDKFLKKLSKDFVLEKKISNEPKIYKIEYLSLYFRKKID